MKSTSLRQLIKEMVTELDNRPSDEQISQAAYKLCQFFGVSEQQQLMKLLKTAQFNKKMEPTTNIRQITQLLNSTNDAGTIQMVKVALK